MGPTLPLAGTSPRRRPLPPEFSRSTPPSLLSGDSSMALEPLKTLPNTVRNCTFPFALFLVSLVLCFFFLLFFYHGVFGRHNTRQRILLLVKDSSAKLKSLTESDHDANANVCSTSFLSFNLMLHV